MKRASSAVSLNNQEEDRPLKRGWITRDEGGERMKKLLGTKTMYYLLMIAALGLLLAESIKWRPGGR